MKICNKCMSWDNYGEVWSIDHIKPLSLFDLDTQPNIVNALCNLRPRFNEYNYSKGNKFIG